MSRKLQKRATKLARKAEHRVMDIRRAVREYHELQSIPGNSPARQLRSQLNIEYAVLEYNRVHKALDRVRKKIHTPPNEPRMRLASPRMMEIRKVTRD